MRQARTGALNRLARTLAGRAPVALLATVMLIALIAPHAALAVDGAPAGGDAPAPAPGALKFVLALLPLLIVLAGIVCFRLSGATMAVVGWIVAVALAVVYFKTRARGGALGGSWYGFVKSFGISIAVIFTMFMIFLMKEVGALGVISGAVKRTVVGKEVAGAQHRHRVRLVPDLAGHRHPGDVPAAAAWRWASRRPPPWRSRCSATTRHCSFALLSIPITLPAEVFGLDLLDVHLQDLPLPAADLGRPRLRDPLADRRPRVDAPRRGAGGRGRASRSRSSRSASRSSTTATGNEIIPVRIIGILAGLLSMAVIIALAAAVPGPADRGGARAVEAENPVNAPRPLAVALALDPAHGARGDRLLPEGEPLAQGRAGTARGASRSSTRSST